MSEILNLRSNRSNDNVTILVKEETDNILEKGFFRVVKMKQVKITTYSSNSSFVPNRCRIRVANQDPIPYKPTSFIVPNDFSKQTQNIDANYIPYALSTPQFVIISIETNLVLENIDILQGSYDLSQSILVYLLNLKSKYLVMRNMKVYENLKFMAYTTSECSALFENIDVNMDMVQTGMLIQANCNYPGATIEGEIIVKDSKFWGTN